MSNRKTNTSIADKLLQSALPRLRRNQIVGSYAVANFIAKLFEKLIGEHEWKSSQHLIDIVRNVGRQLSEAQPLELAIGNVVRRILFIIREEYEEFIKENPIEASHSAAQQPPMLRRSASQLFNVLVNSGTNDLSDPQNLKSNIISAIEELRDEISDSYINISEQSTDHIHTNEVIMIVGKSLTVTEFLKAASSKRKFHVIVVESSPSCEGKATALELSKHGIQTTLIPDSAVFAVMARVNMVIAGSHAVMANGGLITNSGLHTVALAAKRYSIPFVVTVCLYKLTPLYPYENDSLSFNHILNPSSILNFQEYADLAKNVEVIDPAYDYIPPELVSLFITNFGAHSPSYVYRLLAEYYHPDDYSL
eukprot:TRINITY_DN8521_c0_g1_i1.p1 TRINITY_DN8521_c0_g1~~TRINITY_DN8521_c0_g1_i1.p1  ORF type:complete len:365 (-),score=128.66 TRINITY_DN8521_c0_g1_i1:7-1101(-)